MTAPTNISEPRVLTPTCQDEPTIAGVVDALESAWAAIRTRHPEIPAAVIIIASGSPTKANQPMTWGHFMTGRWQHGDNQHPEVMVSGEGLKRPAPEVFTTLLHEATHGLADARGVKDTSRQGRWHNKRFADLAAELGMTTTKDNKLGFSPCTLTEITAARYRVTIEAIAQALTLYRHAETIETKERTNNNNGVTAQCECPRKLRVSTTVFDAGPIRCDLCGEAFLPDEVDRDAFNANVPNPHKPTTDATDGGEPDDDSEDPMVFYDPTGARYGRPTYPYKMAIAAQILWRKGKRVAYLYHLHLAVPKRPATEAQLAALKKAMTVRRTCPTCGQVKPYCIPARYGECLDCAPQATR